MTTAPKGRPELCWPTPKTNGAPAGLVVVEVFAYFHAERIAAAMKAEQEASGYAMQ